MSNKIGSHIDNQLDFEDDDSEKPSELASQPARADAGSGNQNVVVLFKLTADREKAKREAAKARRGFIRDRLRERDSG